MISEPPYVGGDPNTCRIEVNPEVEEGRFNLWRDLRAMYTRISVMYEQQDGMEYFVFERMQALWEEALHANQIAHAIRGTPGHECVPRIIICRKYRVSTYLPEHELRKLKRSGHKVTLLTGTRWGLIPIDDERFWNWEQYKCEFCRAEYCAPQPIKKEWELPSGEVSQMVTFPNFINRVWN